MLQIATFRPQERQVAFSSGGAVSEFVQERACHHNFLVYLTEAVWNEFCYSRQIKRSVFAVCDSVQQCSTSQTERVIIINMQRLDGIDVPAMEMFHPYVRGSSALLLATRGDLIASEALSDFTNLYPNNLGAFFRVGDASELTQDLFKITEAVKSFRRDRKSFKDTNVIVGNQIVASRFNDVGYDELKELIAEGS